VRERGRVDRDWAIAPPRTRICATWNIAVVGAEISRTIISAVGASTRSRNMLWLSPIGWYDGSSGG
jgi:hypothetical protein